MTTTRWHSKKKKKEKSFMVVEIKFIYVKMY